MANIIERNLSRQARDTLKTMVAAGLGLFIGLRYNLYITNVFDMIFPKAQTFMDQTLIIIALTAGVVWLTLSMQKWLDGK